MEINSEKFSIILYLQDIIVLNNRITNAPKLFATRGEIFL